MCLRCRSAQLLCGKPVCPILVKYRAFEKTLPMVNGLDLDGTSPPAVFVGRFGYPKVSVGPLLSPEHGSTELMDTPEEWVGRSVAEVVSFRTGLVRGTTPIRVTDAERPIPILEDLQKTEGYEVRTFAVPPPGVEMGAQVLDITQRFHPDFVIDHLFGRSPSVAIKEYKRAGYPLSKVLGLVWASAEADIDAAGGWKVAEGYNTMSFAGVGDDYPVRQEIKAMYKAQGKEPPKEMDDTVMYNRGLFIAALHVEAIRNALKANGGKVPTGDEVKKGLESIHDFTLGGLVPPLNITASDHEGGGWVQIYQVHDGKFVKETDWIHAYPDVVAAAVQKAE